MRSEHRDTKSASLHLSYATPGVTSLATEEWVPPRSGYRVYERTVPIGAGDEIWNAAREALMSWGVKTRSGFRVETDEEVATTVIKGNSYWLIALLGFISVREPVRIVDVVDEAARCGFAYGTLEGHPISGEEAFFVHRSGAGVFLTIRSLTRPGNGKWKVAYPIVLIAQHWYRRRYLRAL